jgi:dUTP pyrophosphatase
MLTVKVRRLEHGEGLPMPAYQSKDAAGLDLVAAVPVKASLVLSPGQRVVVPTGLSFELPPGTEAQVRPRSGLAAKSGITVLNAPGTIDADYRGEVSVILVNLGAEPFAIQRGDRIAQVIFAPVTQAKLVETSALSKTARGAGGFGSTGVSVTASSSKAKKRKSISGSRKTVKTRSKTAAKSPRR